MTRPDPDDLNRVCQTLLERHGALQVTPPSLSTGSVTIFAEDGSAYRYTAQSRLIYIGKGIRS